MSVLYANGTASQLVPWSGPTIASGNFTFAMRVYATAATLLSDQEMCFLDTSGGATATMFIDDHGGAGPRNWASLVTDDAHSIFSEASDPSTLSLSTWYHLAMTWDGTSNRLYVNGALVNTNTPAALTRAGNWLNWAAPSNFQGAMQDVVTYNATLTADEIMQLYRARMPLRRANLVKWEPRFTNPGTDDLSGVGVSSAISGTAPTAGNDLAAIPWGVGISPQAFRLAPLTAITAHGDQLETGLVDVGLSKSAASSGSQLETGLVTAGLTKDVGIATGSALQTGIVNVTGGSVFLNGAASGSQLQTGAVAVTLTKDASAAGSQLQTATAATTETAQVVAGGSQTENGFVSVTGGTSGSVVGGQNGGQGRRFGNRLMPGLMRRG